MASETEITVRGRLGMHPELQRGEGKKPWLRLRVATNRRVRTGEGWADGPTSWYDVKLWGDFAENAAESLHKGDAVIVQGELYIEEYVNSAGITLRTAVIHANALGPDLRAATARVTRVARVPQDEGVIDSLDHDGAPRTPPEPVDLSGMEEIEEEKELASA